MSQLPEQPKRARQTAASLYINRDGHLGDKGLVEFLVHRESDVRGDMGAFTLKRDRWKEMMENDFSHREVEEDGNIFTKSNHTLGAVRSQIVYKVARTREDLLGSTPWFACQPEGQADQLLAEKLYRHFAWKLNTADARTVIEESIERAFNFGEAIMRLCWKKNVDRFERFANVVVRNGAPVLTVGGDYLTDESETMEAEVAALPYDKTATQMAAMQSGFSAQGSEYTSQGSERQEPGPLVFVDAPEVPYPTADNGLTWEEYVIPEETVNYDGIQFEHVDYTAFRCPMGFRSVADAPFRGHVYQMLRSDLRERLLGLYGPEEEWSDGITALWEKTATDTNGQKTDEKQRVTADKGDDKNPLIKMLDAEVLWSAAGDGDARWFFATVLLDHQDVCPVNVEYLANVLKTGHTLHRSLYTAVAVDPLPGNWHGRGDWEKFEEFNTLVDSMMNTMLHRDNMSSNPMSGMNWSAIHEHPEEVQFRPGAKVTLKEGKTMKDFIDFADMPDRNFATNEQLQFIITTNMLETGVTSAARGGVGDLPATNTATGIQSVLSSGSTLHTKPANDIRRGWEITLTNGAALVYSRHDKSETFAYGEGAEELIQLTPADVRDLTMNITLLMTRSKNAEILEKSRTAIGVHQQYLAIPEMEKEAARPLYVSLLKGLEIPGANEIIRQPMEQDPNAGQPPPPDPMAQIRVTYDELPTVCQVQFLQKMGFEVSAEEIQAERDAREAKEKAEEAKNEPTQDTETYDA